MYKKIQFSLFSLLLFIQINAQVGLKNVDEVVDLAKLKNNEKDSIKYWKSSGVLNISANQSSFSNWLAGGNNNISAIGGINYNINYKKEKWLWDNKIILGYGISQNEGENLIKTDDRIELNSILGKQASGYWSYSFFMNFRTQFTDGFDYKNDQNELNRTSTFFAPAYLTFGPGMIWKKSDKLYFNCAPATSKMTIVSDEVFLFANSLPISSNLTEVYGVAAGENLRYELGFFANAYYEFKIMENISMKNSLALYSNYLEETKNVDLDYTGVITMKVNKWFSSTLTYQTIYDDNAFKGFQSRQIFGFGLNYVF